jgi:hypothetical protein
MIIAGDYRQHACIARSELNASLLLWAQSRPTGTASTKGARQSVGDTCAGSDSLTVRAYPIDMDGIKTHGAQK